MRMGWRMRRALAVLGSVGAACSLEEAAEAADVSLAALAKWFEMPEFREGVRAAAERASEAARAEVWRALLDKCRSGDTSAIRLYFDLKDRKREEAGGSVAIIDDISRTEK